MCSTIQCHMQCNIICGTIQYRAVQYKLVQTRRREGKAYR